jgi:hypothetical protein
VRGAGSQLDDLRAAVNGIGPGYSIVNKISYVHAALASNDVPGSCSILSAFVHEANARSGKKIPAGLRRMLVPPSQQRADGREADCACTFRFWALSSWTVRSSAAPGPLTPAALSQRGRGGRAIRSQGAMRRKRR